MTPAHDPHALGSATERLLSAVKTVSTVLKAAIVAAAVGGLMRGQDAQLIGAVSGGLIAAVFLLERPRP